MKPIKDPLLLNEKNTSCNCSMWCPLPLSGWFLAICLREIEMFYLTMHSTHFIYGYMVSDIWLRTILIVRKETCCCHIGCSYRLTARVLLYAPSHRQDSTYHSLCYTSRGALAGTRNSSIIRQDNTIYIFLINISFSSIYDKTTQSYRNK